MGIQDTLYNLIGSLINLVLNGGAGFFVFPFLIMFAIVRMLRWALSVSRGSPDTDDLQAESIRLRGEIDRAPQRARDAARSFRRRF